MTEIFDELAAVDDAITEEDRVVHILASLSKRSPDTSDMDILVCKTIKNWQKKI